MDLHRIQHQASFHKEAFYSIFLFCLFLSFLFLFFCCTRFIFLSPLFVESFVLNNSDSDDGYGNPRSCVNMLLSYRTKENSSFGLHFEMHLLCKCFWRAKLKYKLMHLNSITLRLMFLFEHSSTKRTARESIVLPRREPDFYVKQVLWQTEHWF